MNNTEKNKRKFRNSSKWKNFRKYISDKFDKTDPISHKSLRKGYTVHHLLLDKNKYEELKEENFIPLNKQMHDVIHICYNYAKNDEKFMERLYYYVKLMIDINC